MRKFNYRITVHVDEPWIHVGFRGIIPEEYKDSKIRVQAIFMQRQVERRFPMHVEIREEEQGKCIVADAKAELPYIFYNPPRHNVNIIFAVWADMEEIILDRQPFPVNKELFARSDFRVKRNIGRFAFDCATLPVRVMKNYGVEKDKKAALKKANAQIYEDSGYSFSPRQRNTDYFARKYEQEVKNTEVEPNNILFLSERLPEAGGNLQRVKERMEEDPSLKIEEFISTQTIDILPRKEIKRCAKLCAKAAVIILEDFYPQLHSVRIRPETKVVQLWHACGAFKTFGFTRMGKQGGAPQSSMNHRNYDMVTVSSEAIRSIYAEAFGITPSKVKALGVPRTDVLFDMEYKNRKRRELYKKYPQLGGKKIILFAPTFRGDGNKDAYYPMDVFPVEHFMEEMAEDTVCIVKQHPFVKEELSVDEAYKHCVLDLSKEEHINDLLLITDLLITDYSSSVFEAAILDVPMLFYAFDKEEYINSRDFYCNYDRFAPGYVETEIEGLRKRARELLSGDESDQKQKNEVLVKKLQFQEDFLSALDGHSTERIVKYIKENFIGKNFNN